MTSSTHATSQTWQRQPREIEGLRVATRIVGVPRTFVEVFLLSSSACFCSRRSMSSLLSAWRARFSACQRGRSASRNV